MRLLPENMLQLLTYIIHLVIHFNSHNVLVDFKDKQLQ